MGRRNTNQDVLREIAKLPKARDKRSDSWITALKENDPDKLDKLIIVIRDFRRGGVTREKFNSLVKLHKYLTGQDKERPIKEPLLPPSVKCHSFREFVREHFDG